MSDGPAIPAYGARRAMPTESFLDQATGFDIDGHMRRLEGPSAVVEDLKRSRDQITAVARKLLDAEMLPLLEWLLDITLRRPMILPNLGPESVSYVALREGHNQIAWQILRAIAEGRDEQPPNREGL